MALELSEHVFVASMVAWTLASAGVLHRLSWPAEHPNSALAAGHHLSALDDRHGLVATLQLQLDDSLRDHRGQQLVANAQRHLRKQSVPALFHDAT